MYNQNDQVFRSIQIKSAFTIGGTLALIGTLLFTSCIPARKAMYFPDLTKDTVLIDPQLVENSKRVYSGDRIQLQIVTTDLASNALLNAGQMSQGGLQAQGGGGYLIDPEGFIEIPSIGKLKVKGLTPSDIRELVRERVRVLYKEVSVYCTYTGGVTIMERSFGMGGSNGFMQQMPINNERLTILEALGNMPIATSRIDKAWVIRERDGKRETVMLNLNTNAIFSSPHFYLQNNDLIYIEPNRTNRFIEANAPTRNLVGIVTGFSGLIFGLLAYLNVSK